MGKSPFRRDVPGKSRQRETPMNPEFKDISKPEELLAFIKANRNVLDDQDAEIDNRVSQSNDTEPAPPQPMRIERRVPQRSMAPVQEIVEEELEQHQDEDDDDNEPVEQKESNPAPSSTPPNIANKMRQMDLSKLDPATRKRVEEGMKDRPNQKVITNMPTGEAASVQAPPISNTQMRRKVEQEVKEALQKDPKTDPLEPPKTEMRFNINTPDDAEDYDWERFEPVSGCIFYEHSEIFVRRFNLVDTMRVSNAMESGNITAFIDALGNCVQKPFNIRDLSYPDFRHLLYWHWFNSYTKVPHDLKWKSKYGNENLYKVIETNLKLKTPKIDRVTYQEWQAKGYAVPTLRDAEIFMKESLTDQEIKLLERAQYFAGDPTDPSIQSKIDGMTRACRKSTLPIQELPDFKKAIYHEVVENVDVVDAKFNPRTWIQLLKGQVQLIEKEIAEYESAGDSLSALGSEDERLDLEKEIARLEEGLAANKGGAELADVETIRLDRPILEFFPDL